MRKLEEQKMQVTKKARRKGENKINATKIEWVKNPDGSQGYTWNPITGCLNGCPYCYVRKLANGRLKKRYQVSDDYSLPPRTDRIKGYSDPFYPRFWPEKFKDLVGIGDKAPRGIFVCNMSDLFGIGVPEKWTRHVLEAIGNQTRHRFYLLTKQPQNLAKFSPFPDNCWVGVSCTNQAQFTVACDYLSKIESTVKFISFEPLLGSMQTSDYIWQELYLGGISWVICGAQTKPDVMPEISWVREIVDAADKVGVKVFLKDNLGPLLEENRAEWAFDIMKDYSMYLRQGMPGLQATKKEGER